MEIETITSKENSDNYKNKEWPGVQEKKNCKTVIKPELLIMELGRLVPSLEGEYVRFSPVNMPTIRISCTHIIGLILEVSRNSKQYKFTVDDGTGILKVICKLQHVWATRKGDQEKKAEISKDGLKDKDLFVGSYVYLQGFLSLSEYNRSYKNCEDKNPLKRLVYGQPVFYAVNIEFISEKQYYMKMYIWLKAARKRYTQIIHN